MAQKHSTPPRGLMSVAKGPQFEGRFGRLFPDAQHAKFGVTDQENERNLAALGIKMSAGFDPPKDGKDDEESGIPALYTYLAQFLDHDLTFDPASSLQMQKDPDALTDFRSPAFDLDNVYGRGPDDQPSLYDGGNSFLLGDPITNGDPNAMDLPRNTAKIRRALIGDPRNDENAIVSQLQGLFLRFHNRTLKDNPNPNDSVEEFKNAQKLVRFHYQYVILNDFLPRIVDSAVLNDYKTNGHYDRKKLKFYHPKTWPFMPVEFSVAAYRLGHSMIRPGYRLNDAVLLPIFPVPATTAPGFSQGLTGFRAMVSNWGIDWGRFIDIDSRVYDGAPFENQTRLQFAYRIDTSVVNPLSTLPAAVAANPSSLPQRNLLRGWRLGLPSGQEVARAMRITPLPDNDIRIGKGVDKPAVGEEPVSINTLGSAFKENCPLWTYILAEAMRHPFPVHIPVKGNVSPVTTPRLGPVGGGIVTEVFLALMFEDPTSLLSSDHTWRPKNNPNYALKDFVNYALGN
jgi:heme peroxidase